ncbi:type I DNA topoisomerase [Flavihumibacter petaseus]|uniref:DNA topoisomerase 1 n=1 Tax=Flavihumibacter petaseus NBRC 106054 TaxID=1220578 RepID=A0A0E9N3L1_9BACT|nr:type I DNA topoisomerase [Flavihumibacter petaseus]GAO43945.1 DNA topoisomerase I [Flavihumibacter petaseus NBRC 106054]
MAKNLLIVESPAKAKTIEKILGKDFEVKSCYGHIRDLEKGEMGIDIKNQYKPRYIVPDDKERVVRELKQLAKKSDEVWLATDEDREGEAISWHLCEVLGLDPLETKRIVFHEITKPAIQKAVQNPRKVNMDLVNAQQARRVLDRIVGFELSPVLWRKMSMGSSLSAGRVQSVAVRLIAEREREINAFNATSQFKIDAYFTASDHNERPVSFRAEGQRFSHETDAESFLLSCRGAEYQVSDIQVRPGKKSPAAPFTTSTLQQEASRKLGYSVSRTMLLAQKLYESGKITYMRTDSVNLSDTAMDGIRQQVNEQYGNKYFQARKYKNKNESAQEAHEAIRPTYMDVTSVGDPDTQRLYELIWKRTMASQMADAELEKTTAKIRISTNKEELTASGEVLKFDGFLKVYREDRDEEDQAEEEAADTMLPALLVGQKLPLRQMTATERFNRPAPRYTEASLVKKLEELGIGRPSTYAPTISTILKRGYVEKRDKEGVKRTFRVLRLEHDKLESKTETENTGAEKSKLFPTDLGLVVTDFLNQYFNDVMDYGFTAKIEEEFDEVANGKRQWHKMIDEFYNPFKKDVDNTIENAERIKGERELGTDPESGKKVVARMGRYGPMVQIGDVSDEEKPRFAKLKSGQSIETISYAEAMELFRLPLTIGEYEGSEVSVNIGRFGPYVKWGEEFISIPRGEDPLTVDLERAVDLIQSKKEADAPIATYEGLPVTKGKGRFGPFIKWNDLFINIPKAYNFDRLTQRDCEELIQKKLEKEANRYIRQWPEEKISIENGRWGPFIRMGKKMLKVTRKEDGGKWEEAELKDISLDAVKAMIVAQDPTAFDKKSAGGKATKKAPAKKAATKKSAAPKKPATKKTATKSAPKKKK